MMKRKLVFATNNAHKLEEIAAILGDKVELLSLNDIDCHTDIPETADKICKYNAEETRIDLGFIAKKDCQCDGSDNNSTLHGTSSLFHFFGVTRCRASLPQWYATCSKSGRPAHHDPTDIGDTAASRSPSEDSRSDRRLC